MTSKTFDDFNNYIGLHHQTHLDTIHSPVENFQKHCVSQEEILALGMEPILLNAVPPVVSRIPHWKMTSVPTVYSECCKGKWHLFIFTEHLRLASTFKEHLIERQKSQAALVQQWWLIIDPCWISLWYSAAKMARSRGEGRQLAFSESSQCQAFWNMPFKLYLLSSGHS